MTQQDASISEVEADNHIKPKPVKVKGKNGPDQDESTPAKKPRHSIKENNHKWKCAICTVGFRLWNELNAHVVSAHEDNQWQCKHCGRTYSTQGNLVRHMRLKHSSVTQKKCLIQYQCMHCRRIEDTFDAAVYHAQVHLVQEAMAKNGTQYKQSFHNQKSDNNSLIKIIFDYKTLLKDAWFDMFQNLTRPLKIEASSLYRHTRCIKLNFGSGSRNEEKGRCVLLYQCGVCELIVKPAKVQRHCDKNGACQDFRDQGYQCTECNISFYTSKGLRRHKESHENNQSLLVKIATFNNKDDVHFNNILKQISRSSVDDTHEDTELDEISRNIARKDRSNVQAHKENSGEASKDNDYDRIENGFKSVATMWDSDNDSNDSNRQSPALVNSKKSFGGVFTKKDEIIQKNSNDNLNSVKNTNYDNVAKEGIVGKNDQSAIKRRRISGEDNKPGGMLEADKSQSTEDQGALENNVESVHSRDNSEENEDFDQRNREIQEDTGTTANIRAVNKPVSRESILESSEYVSLNDNTAILHGSFHQEDLRFNSSRGKQCTGIAAVACAAFCVLNPNAWTKSVIDKILVIGDKYYNHCIDARTLPAAGEVNPDYLAITDLMTTIIFNKLSVPIAFEENTNLNGHIDNDDSSKGFPNLKNALKLFFSLHASGILTSNAMSVAVYCKTVGEAYWLFDSHSRGPEGGPALGGAACCMRFSNLDDLHALLRCNLFVSPSEDPKGRDLKNNLNVFSLTSLSVREPNGKLA